MFLRVCYPTQSLFERSAGYCFWPAADLGDRERSWLVAWECQSQNQYTKYRAQSPIENSQKNSVCVRLLKFMRPYIHPLAANLLVSPIPRRLKLNRFRFIPKFHPNSIRSRIIPHTIHANLLKNIVRAKFVPDHYLSSDQYALPPLLAVPRLSFSNFFRICSMPFSHPASSRCL